MDTRLWLATVVVLAITACSEPPPYAPSAKTAHRSDFAPEEFGIGRSHTRNARCNREIDRMLNEIRNCYNTGPEADCDALQRTNSDRIGRLTIARRCGR